MCEFCHQHGEGKKWYLQARHYADDLLSDARRQRLVTGFFSARDPAAAAPSRRRRLLRHMPSFVKRAMTGRAQRRLKQSHFGQVLPLEDVAAIFSFTNSIIRLPCACRRRGLGREFRSCYGVSLGPDGGALGDLLRGVDASFRQGPDGADLETLSRDEALRAFADHEQAGLCHTVWTFITPFIGGICNCDRVDCVALRATLGGPIRTMFRAEYIAEVNPDLCTGCRDCLRLCQFGALAYAAAAGKVVADPRRCFGCGLCRNACPQHAITLRPRSEVPAAAALW